MSYSNNPNLLNPQATTNDRVQALPAMTQPLPNAPLEQTEYYTMSMLNHHMHRTDGKRLAFMFGIFEAKDVYDKQYMDNEISSGNPYIRKASQEEIQAYNMRVDPRGTVVREITPDIEERVRGELQAQLREEHEKKMNSVMALLTDEQRKQLEEKQGRTATTQPPSSDTSSIQGTDKFSGLTNRLKDGIKTEGATVLSSGANTPFSTSIAGSDKTTNFTE